MDRWFRCRYNSVTYADSLRVCSAWLMNNGSGILLSVWVSDLWRLAKGNGPWLLELGNVDPVIDPSQRLVATRLAVVPLDKRMKDRCSGCWYESLTYVNSPRSSSPWLLELWIGDSVIDPSRWLVATRQWGVSLVFWNYWSVIPSSIQVSDLCWFFKSLIRLTKELWIGDPVIHSSRWLVATRQRKISPWLCFGIMDRWSWYPF